MSTFKKQILIILACLLIPKSISALTISSRENLKTKSIGTSINIKYQYYLQKNDNYLCDARNGLSNESICKQLGGNCGNFELGNIDWHSFLLILPLC